MSQDRELEQYLQGKSDISRAYAELPSVNLPDHLDAAILAEAHRAVGARPGGARKRRWAVPLSLVATLFVVVMVGLQWPYLSRDAGMPLPTESRPTPAMQDEAAAPAVEAEQRRSVTSRGQEAVAREPLTAAAPVPLVMAKPDAMAERRQLDTIQSPAAPAAAAPAMPEWPAAEKELLAAKAKKEEGQAAVAAREAYGPEQQAAGLLAPRTAPAPQTSAPQLLANAARDEPVAELPQHWLQRIEKLKQQGRLEEAGKELAAFRKRYPDYVVPPALQGLSKPPSGR